VPTQKTSGIHIRLRSRAFIIGDGAKRVVFVAADLGMLFQMVKLKVSEKIAADPDLSPTTTSATFSFPRRTPTEGRVVSPATFSTT